MTWILRPDIEDILDGLDEATVAAFRAYISEHLDDLTAKNVRVRELGDVNARLFRRLQKMQARRGRDRDRETHLTERIGEVRRRHRRMQAERDHAILVLEGIARTDGSDAGPIARLALDVIRSNTTDSPLFTEAT